jgi:hypothetical protein
MARRLLRGNPSVTGGKGGRAKRVRAGVYPGPCASVHGP